MAAKLNSTLERYFAATNRHDVNSMIAEFAPDAVVKDEDHEHRGDLTGSFWTKRIVRNELGKEHCHGKEEAWA